MSLEPSTQQNGIYQGDRPSESEYNSLSHIIMYLGFYQ